MIHVASYLKSLKNSIQLVESSLLKVKMNIEPELPAPYHGSIGEVSVYVTKKKHLVLINLMPDFSVDIDELALIKLNELYDKLFDIETSHIMEVLLLEILTRFYTESK